MSREAHVRFCEGLAGKFRRSTLLRILTAYLNEVVEEFGGEENFYKMNMPDWLLSLQPGAYSVNDLVKISKTKRRNVSQIMKKYCAKIEYVNSAKEHLKKCIYHWE